MSGKIPVLSVLKQRWDRAQVGLQNAAIRQITRFDRNQVTRLMRELRQDVPQVHASGYGARARYFWQEEGE